ncbi:MAG: DUF2157 domain-containing protein [Dehalococcoidales bacterium]|nr:DUF2157 domain-containing protein [Dehalococcoidales bacterium]
MSKSSFDITDLERWQKQGFISEQQLETIVNQENIETKPASEKKSGWNLITVLYYFGGFLALLSFTLFIGMSWDDFSQWARFAVALIALAVTGGLGFWLRFMQKFEVAGGLLLFVATAILPLLVYTITSLAGFWAEGASFYELRFSVLVMGLISLAGAIAVVYYTRFPLIALLTTAFAHLMLIDLIQMIWGKSFLFNESTAVISAIFILFGIWMTMYGMKKFAFWVKLYGLIWLLFTFSILFFESESILFGLLYLVVYIIIAAISLFLREAMFMVFAIISIYLYIFNLVFDIFEGSAIFPLILGITGISIVLLAVFFQKYGKRLFRRKIDGKINRVVKE